MVLRMSTNMQPCRPKGTPIGEQFADKTNPESDLELEGDTTQFEPPPVSADLVGGTTRQAAVDAKKRQAAAALLDAKRARRAAMAEVAGDDMIAPLKIFLGTDAGHDGFVAMMTSEARGAKITDRPAYCGRIFQRQQQMRDTRGIAEPQRNRLARWESNRMCKDRAQELGRTLTPAEEDDIATTYAASLSATRRPTPGYHRPPQVVDAGPSFDVASDPGDDGTDDVYGPAQMAAASRQSRPAQLREALGARVMDAGGPATIPASIPTRAAKAVRDEVAAAGGAHQVAVTWIAGPTPLCAPWGTHDGSELSDADRLVIAESVAGLPSAVADDLWGRAMSLASARSKYRPT